MDRITYDETGTPLVNGVTPRWTIGRQTPIRDAAGNVVDIDCELVPANQAAQVVLQARLTRGEEDNN